MNDKLTPKIIKKHKAPKPYRNEWKDFFPQKGNKRDEEMMKKIKMEYVGME